MQPNSRSSTLIHSEVCFEKTLTPDNWQLCVHPQGWIYFYNPTLKVVTDQDIREEHVYELVTKNTAQYPLSELDEQMEVQLHVQTHLGTQGAASFNLVVNHKHCVASYERHEVRDNQVHALTPNTLNRRRRLYWNYLWNHPAHVPTPDRAIPDATDALTWYYTDNLISGAKSIVPFSKLECEDLSRVVQGMTNNNTSVAKTVFLSWLLREVCSFRDSESYGQYTQKAAKAIRDTRTLGSPGPRKPHRLILPVVNIVITLLFFGIPHIYLAHVKDSSGYRGRLANVQRNWEDYIERIAREYSHFLLISTVLLSATVGFLAVPEIADAARVTATVSALASLSSIIVGVFSIWRHQTNTRTADSFAYMHNAQHGYLGFHGHAMLLSLPPVLLVWAIVAFTISIIAYTLQGLTNINTIDRVSAWTVMGIFFILLVVVIMALYTFSIIWKFRPHAWRIGYHFKPLICVWRSDVDIDRGY